MEYRIKWTDETSGQINVDSASAADIEGAIRIALEACTEWSLGCTQIDIAPIGDESGDAVTLRWNAEIEEWEAR